MAEEVPKMDARDRAIRRMSDVLLWYMTYSDTPSLAYQVLAEIGWDSDMILNRMRFLEKIANDAENQAFIDRPSH